MKSLFKTGRTEASMSKYLCLGMIFDICVLFQPWSLVHGWEKLSSLHTFWEPHFLWTLCATAIEWFPEPMVHRRQTVTDPNPIVLWACALNTDAENPWWRACAEIPSCRLRMLTTHLPATTCQQLESSVRPQSCWSQMMNQAEYHGMDFCTSKGSPKKIEIFV